MLLLCGSSPSICCLKAASGCVSCCVWVTWPAWTVWSVCTASAARKRAAACQSCMDYCEHLANFAVRTIRLAFWVNFLQLCLHCHIQQHKHSDTVNTTGIPPLLKKTKKNVFLLFSCLTCCISD